MGGGISATGPTATRRVTLAVGSLVLLAVATIMWVRGVDRVEVAGTLLYLPVFVGLVLGRVRGGLVAGAIAAAAYVALRYPAIEAIGLDRFDGLLAARVLAYLAFGGVGGWAFAVLEQSLDKLEMHDQIDDVTGLHNARFFVQETGLELARSQRYSTVFSVVQVDIPAASLDGLPRRRRDAALRAVGDRLAAAARTVDRVVHAPDGQRHRLVLLLPETGKEGALVVASRMVEGVAESLARRGAVVEPGDLTHRVVTYPGDDEALDQMRREFAVLDRQQHPQAAEDVAEDARRPPPSTRADGTPVPDSS